VKFEHPAIENGGVLLFVLHGVD